jgi:hypothetical protein
VRSPDTLARSESVTVPAVEEVFRELLDRLDDIETAHGNGLCAIAASYGYGSVDELALAEATAALPAAPLGIVCRCSLAG